MRNIYIFRFDDGALMRFDGSSWTVMTAGDPDWADAFDLGHSIPSVLHPLGSDLFGAWHIPHLGKTRAGVFRDGVFIQLTELTGTVGEQMAWSNPINYRGRVRWLAVSSLNNDQHVFQIDGVGRMARLAQNVSPDWSTFSAMANERSTQLSFGARVQAHNEKLHCGSTTFSSDRGCRTNPIVMDHRMFFDMGTGVHARPVPLEGQFSEGQLDLLKPLSADGYDFFIRTMIGQVSFKGQMFYISIDGKLRWQDDLHFTHQEIYDLSRELDAFDPGTTINSPNPDDPGKDKPIWIFENKKLYASVWPYDFLCRIDIRTGQLAPAKALNTGYEAAPCFRLLTEDGCFINTEAQSRLLVFDDDEYYYVQTEKVRNVTKSLPSPIAGDITYPNVDNGCRAYYQIPAGTQLEVAYALAGCTTNDLNAVHPVTIAMFEFRESVWAVIAAGAPNRSTKRPPSVLVKLDISLTPTTWLSARPEVTGHTETLLTEDSIPLNVSGMVPIVDDQEGMLHLLYEDPETQQVKHLEVNLGDTTKQQYRGVAFSTARDLPGGFTLDNRAALTQGCAMDYDTDEPFVFITGMSLRKDHKSVSVDYVVYSPSSQPVTVDFRHAIGTLNRGFRGDKPGFVQTTALVQDPQHERTARLTSSPTGVHHRFVHNLEADGLDKFNGELQYEALPHYGPV